MPIDVIYLLLLAMAIYKGYSRGLIVALFSFFAILIGLAAAVKLSAVVANWLAANMHVGATWLPVLSFVITMLGIIVIIRIVASLIQKTVELMFMGLLNKLGGIVLYALLYSMVYSVVLFYGHQIGIISSDTIKESATYIYLQPFGPNVVNLFGKIIPMFKNIFQQLEVFFGTAAKTVS